MNSLTQTFMFNKQNYSLKIMKKIQSINFSKYRVPKELYEYKIESIKGFNYPFVKETVEGLKKGTIIPILFNDPVNINDEPLDRDIPSCYFNFSQPLNNSGEFVTYVNMSSNGNYKRSKVSSIPEFFNCDDRAFYHLASEAYVQNKLLEFNARNTLTRNIDFCKQIASWYAVLMTKAIDRNYSMPTNEAYEMLLFLCMMFCLESMIGLSKEESINIAKKFKLISDPANIINNSVYCNSDRNMMEDVDYVKIFPIMNFSDILKQEFGTFKTGTFSHEIIIMNFISMYGTNSVFAVEQLSALVTMYILSKGKIKLYNDFIIDKNTEIIKNDVNKVMNTFFV